MVPIVVTLSIGAGIPFKLSVRFLRQTVKFLGDMALETVAQHIRRNLPPSIFNLIQANVASPRTASNPRQRVYNVRKVDIDFATFIKAKTLNARRQLYPIDASTGERVTDLKVRRILLSTRTSSPHE